MLNTGDVIDLGPLGAKFIIKKTAVETNGQSFDMEWKLGPQTGGTPIHTHPHSIETFEVLQGAFDVYVDGNWKTLSASEQLSVAKGVPHTFRNASNEPTRVIFSLQPAMKFDQYFESLSKLADSGFIRSNQLTFKALLYLSVLMTSYQDEIQSVNPPNAIMQVFGFIGRLLGYKALYQ